jgi:hypothetical protein
MDGSMDALDVRLAVGSSTYARSFSGRLGTRVHPRRDHELRRPVGPSRRRLGRSTISIGYVATIESGVTRFAEGVDTGARLGSLILDR